MAVVAALAAACSPTGGNAPNGTKPPAGPGDISITRRDAQQLSTGPAESFTGTVRVRRLFSPTSPSKMQGAYVSFEPGAHTAWHTHPLGQLLVVTEGTGRTQQWGGAVQEIREGDVVWTPPNVKHWHGATPTSAMTHMAIVEQLDGKSAEWMEKVSEAQYGSAR
jgi:quercetin dioxygenase-like cupin family protein